MFWLLPDVIQAEGSSLVGRSLTGWVWGSNALRERMRRWATV